MFDQILVPTDGSTETEQAVAHALGLARACEATVHVVSVVEETEYAPVVESEEREQLRAATEEVGRSAIADVVQQAEPFDIQIERELRHGSAHEELLAYASEQDIDLVVMGTHGQTGTRRELGSTTLRVVRNADVPVLTVRFREGVRLELGEYSTFYDDILVATDGSDGASLAAEHAVDIAALYDANVHALYVVNTSIYAFDDVPRSIVGLLETGGRTALEEIEKLGDERGVDVRTTVRRGRPSEELRDYADGNDVDLVAAGAHGQTSEVHLGSTTERLVQTAKRPTLTIR